VAEDPTDLHTTEEGGRMNWLALLAFVFVFALGLVAGFILGLAIQWRDDRKAGKA
jgi:hypothetical protein